MKIIKQLLEATNFNYEKIPSFNDKDVYTKIGVDKKTLQRRQYDITRTINTAKKAKETAEKADNSPLADTLQRRIDELSEILEYSKNVDVALANDDKAEETSTQSNSQPQEATPDSADQSAEEDSTEDTIEDDVNGVEGDDGNGDDDEANGGDSDGNDANDDKYSDDAILEPATNKNGPEKSNQTTNNTEQEADFDNDDSVGDNNAEQNNNSDKNVSNSDKNADDDLEDDLDDELDGNEENDEDSDNEKSTSSPSSSKQPNGQPKIEDKKILLDPFSRQVGQELPDSLRQKVKEGELEIESEYAAIRRILSSLKGDAKRGAKAAILNILRSRGEDVTRYIQNDKNESLILKEAVKKHLAIMSDDEFNGMINRVLDDVDKVTKPNYSTDIAVRAQEIKSDAQNIVKNRELSQDDILNTKDKAAQQLANAKARENELNKYDAKRLPSLAQFTRTLYKAIANQVDVEEDTEETWAVVNRRYDSEPDIIKKGDKRDDLPTDVPVIDVYFDQSGSWDAVDIEAGRAAIANINDFAKKSQIKLNLYYFSDRVYSSASAARAGGSTMAIKDILQNIVATKATNVIVITDADMDTMGAQRIKTKTWVDGYVWYLFKNMVSQIVPQILRGRKGTLQYRLY